MTPALWQQSVLFFVLVNYYDSDFHHNLFATFQIFSVETKTTKEKRARINIPLDFSIVISISIFNYSHVFSIENNLRLTKNAELVKQIKYDFNKVNLERKDYKMLKYAVELTTKPSELHLKDIEKLRQVGFNDNDILNINLITVTSTS